MMWNKWIVRSQGTMLRDLVVTKTPLWQWRKRGAPRWNCLLQTVTRVVMIMRRRRRNTRNRINESVLS